MPATPPAAPASKNDDDGAGRIRGRLMAQSLMLLLDRVRGAREVLPHLAALERALAEQGAAAIGQIPPHWLPRICSQLSSLPLPQQDPPLHDLLTRLMDALEDGREPAGFGMERTVVIREISHSEFEAAAAEQATTLRHDRP